MNQEVLERIRYAWIQADKAMDKVGSSYLREAIIKTITGERKITPFIVEVIASATGRTESWLLYGDDEAKVCWHEETWFDRTVCPEPCGGMHTYCTECSARVGPCLLDNLAIGLQQLRDSQEIPAKTLEEERAQTSHVFVPTGPGTCAVCQLDVHAEVHGGYPSVCITCGHATAHASGGLGVCEFGDCGCDGPTQELTPNDVLHLCDRCHGEVYTFPQRITGLSQRLTHPQHRFADFVYTDEDGDELVISDAQYETEGVDAPGVFIQTTPDGMFIPLDTLEAVVDAIRVSGLRSLEGDET